MFSPFPPGVFFDSKFSPSDPRNTDLETKCIHRLYVVSGTAIWFQKFNMVHLSPSWSKIFRIPAEEIFLLEDYLALIENPQERDRISAGRESLISGPPGFEWCDEFTLRGRKVETFAVVAESCIFGLDRVVG